MSRFCTKASADGNFSLKGPLRNWMRGQWAPQACHVSFSSPKSSGSVPLAVVPKEDLALSFEREKETNLLLGAIGAIDRTRSRQKNSVAEALALFERTPLSPFKKKKQNQQRRRIKTQHRSNREGRENGIVVPRCGGRKSRPGRAPPSPYPIRRGRLQNTRPPPASPAPVPQARRQGPRLQRLILHPQLCRFLSLCFIEFLVLFVG